MCTLLLLSSKVRPTKRKKKEKEKSTRQEEREEAEYCSDFGSFWVFNNCCPSFLLEKYKNNTTCIIQGLLFVGSNLGK